MPALQQTPFYNNVDNTISTLKSRNCKYVETTNIKQEDTTSNDKFWNNTLSNISKHGILKIGNLNMKKKNIPNDQIWMKYRYKLDKEESTDDYLKIPQPQQGKEVH